MPSSTSNSDARLPQSRSLLIWFAGVLLAVLMLLGLELFWRHLGHTPSVQDDMDLWSQQRAKLSSDDAHTIALLGWSRSMYNVVPEVIEARHPALTVGNVAIEGKHPVAVLRDLANDESFRGVLLCDITFAGIPSSTWDEQQRHIDYYNTNWEIGKDVERTLTSFVQARLTVVSPRASLKQFLAGVLHDEWEWPFHVTVHADRWWAGDFHAADFDRILTRNKELAGMREEDSAGEPPTEADYIDDVKGLNRFVDAIQSRGGKVVFVRMPTGRRPWRETSKTPAWRALEQHTTAAATIHFGDYPQLAKYMLWDGSHVDVRDAPAFTESLLEILEEKGVLAAER